MIERRLPEGGGQDVTLAGHATASTLRQRVGHLLAKPLHAGDVLALQHRAAAHGAMELHCLRGVVGAETGLREVRIAERVERGYGWIRAADRGEERVDVHLAANRTSSLLSKYRKNVRKDTFASRQRSSTVVRS